MYQAVCYLSAGLEASEGRALPLPAGDQLEGAGGDFVPGGGHACRVTYVMYMITQKIHETCNMIHETDKNKDYKIAHIKK